jgi:hypothetical protein
MDRPRHRVRRLPWPSFATQLVVGVGAGASSAIGLGAWLLLTDPVVAADVAASGDLLPLIEALLETLRTALVHLLAYL